MAFVFQKPVSTKVTTPSGTETQHTFQVQTEAYLPKPMEGLPADALKAALQDAGAYLNGFLTEFLRTCSAYFAKPYTAATILKHLQHDVKAAASTAASYSFKPADLVITSKGFRLLWDAREEQMLIALPGMEEDDIEPEELQVADLPLASTEVALDLNVQPANLRHIYDKQRVKEANLRAKLAQYKANRAHIQYLEKYGEDPSESDDTDSELESESDSE
jgi:hypothetical protein